MTQIQENNRNKKYNKFELQFEKLTESTQKNEMLISPFEIKSKEKFHLIDEI